SSLPGIAPSNTYQCKDGKYIVIGGNGDAIFKRLMNAVGRPDVGEDERFQTNSGRAAHAEFLDDVIETWTKQMDLELVIEVLGEAKVPAGPIYSIEDIVKDKHYLSRGMIKDFQLNEKESLKIPGVVPKVSETPGQTKWLGPDLGEHTSEVMKEWLSYDDSEIRELKEQGIL